MDDLDRKIVAALQDGLPIVAAPYAAVAQQLGISTAGLLDRLQGMLDRGEVRRVSASLAHRDAGIVANVMCVWRVPAEQVERFARDAVAFDAVSHCYERAPTPQWPYNLYAMIHGRREEDCEAVIRQLCEQAGCHDYVALYSVREFKKTWTRL